MKDNVLILKDENARQAVPSTWHDTFSQIVEAFKKGNFSLKRQIAGVKAISKDNAARIAQNINTYGSQLINLPYETWQTSACQ